MRGLSTIKQSRLWSRRRLIQSVALHHHISIQGRRSLSTSASLPTKAERFYLQVGVERTDLPSEDASAHFTHFHRPSITIPATQKVDPDDAESASSKTIPARPKHQQNWYTVTLDGRPLQTPAGRRLVLPSEAWAYGIAAEWNAVERQIQPSAMPLMVTACTALDHSNGIQIDECMRFLQTDTLCYWADPTADRVLYRAQQQAWDPLHHWVRDTLLAQHYPATPMAQVYGIAESMVFLKQTHTTKDGATTTSVGLPHPPQLVQDCRVWLEGLDPWHATIAQLVLRETKSFVLGAAVVTRAASAEQVQTACRIEEENNISNWGLVEGQHDYDRLNSSIQLHAAAFATDCLYVETMEQS